MFAQNAFAQWVDTEMTRRKFDESEMQTQTGLPRETIKQIRKGEKIPSPHEIGLFCRGLPRLKRMGGLIATTKAIYKELEQKKVEKSQVSIKIETPKKENAEIKTSYADLAEPNVSPLNIKTTSNLQFSKIEVLRGLQNLILTSMTTCARLQYLPTNNVDDDDDVIKSAKHQFTELKRIRDEFEKLMTGLVD